MGIETFPPLERSALDAPADSRRDRTRTALTPSRIVLAASIHVAGNCAKRIDTFFEAGVRTFLDPTEKGEGFLPYAPLPRGRAAARRLRAVRHRFVIRNYRVPTFAAHTRNARCDLRVDCLR